MNLLREVEPFPTHHVVPYDTAFLAGFVVEHYQIVLIDALKRARLKSICAGQVPGDTHRKLRIFPSYSGETFKHILVPVWLLTFQYGPRSYQVLVNGYTGRIAGMYPKSLWKILAALTAVLFLVLFLVGLEFL